MSMVYLDIEQLELTGTTSLCIQDVEIVLAGTIINSMSINEKNNEYERYAKDYDIQFIFDDCIPNIDFYTIPLVDIIAKDSGGGFLGSLGQQFDLESDALICYINKDQECFIVSENAKEFLKNIEVWKNNLKVYDKIAFYPSRKDAQRDVEFIDLDYGDAIV